MIKIFNIIQIVIISASVALSVYFYQHFPARVPMHWNVAGEIDGWSSRGFGAFLFPVILIAIYFLFEILPKIDPRRANYPEFKKVYSIFKTAIMAIFFGIYILTGLSGLGVKVAVDLWIPIGIGLLFIILGNYFGKLRNNYFVGIRTPWTLSNEEVWNKTHRLGGKLFILGGVAMMLMGVIPVGIRIVLFIAVVLMISVVPILYSYIIHKRLSK